MNRAYRLLGIVAAASLSLSGAAYAADEGRLVWGGGDPAASVYSSAYVPRVIEVMTGQRLSNYSWAGVSPGTLYNAMKVTENPTNIGVGQWDLLKDLNGQPILDADGLPVNGPDGQPLTYKFKVLAQDIGPECLYMVTDQPGYTSLGHILGNSFDITLATGKDGSGSLGTYERLATIYPELRDFTVAKVGGALDIVQKVKDDDAVNFGFFVMRPDPASETFKLIDKLGLTLVPVVDEAIRDQYTFASLKVAYGGFFGLAPDKMFTTACTSVALITGDPAATAGMDTKTQRLNAAIIDRLGNPGLAKELRPNLATWRDMWDSFKAASADAVNELVEASKRGFEETFNK